MKTLLVLGSPHYALHLADKFKIVIQPWLSLSSPKPDVVLFTGGTDLNFKLYAEKSYGSDIPDLRRDAWEIAWYNKCVEQNIPMIGICRGMQLFTIMTGGFLLQDVKNHYGRHLMYIARGCVEVNSLHHQMCIPKKDTYKLLGFSYRGLFDNVPIEQRKILQTEFSNREPESLWFPKVRALGVQWHPEMMGTSRQDTGAIELYRSMVDMHIGL